MKGKNSNKLLHVQTLAAQAMIINATEKLINIDQSELV